MLVEGLQSVTHILMPALVWYYKFPMVYFVFSNWTVASTYWLCKQYTSYERNATSEFTL